VVEARPYVCSNDMSLGWRSSYRVTVASSSYRVTIASSYRVTIASSYRVTVASSYRVTIASSSYRVTIASSSYRVTIASSYRVTIASSYRVTITFVATLKVYETDVIIGARAVVIPLPVWAWCLFVNMHEYFRRIHLHSR
jgi:hypothetical protein